MLPDRRSCMLDPVTGRRSMTQNAASPFIDPTLFADRFPVLERRRREENKQLLQKFPSSTE